MTANVRGEQVHMLVDSGAENTVLSIRAYRRIPAHQCFTLSTPQEDFRQADGTKVETWGTAWVEIRVGPVSHVVKVVVADISNEGILGMDFLLAKVNSLNFKQLELKTDGGTIQCKTADDKSFCVRVVTTDSVQIPAGHEIIVPGRVSRSLTTSKWAMVEPIKEGHLQTKGIGVARALVEYNEIVPVRLLNAQQQRCTVKSGVAIATLSPVVEDNVHDLRVLSKRTQNDTALEPSLPEHLYELYSGSIEELEDEDKMLVGTLLDTYQDVFSMGDHDLGRTNLVKHKIDTGTARPIRQPFRRLPLGQREEVERQVQGLLEKGAIQPSDSPWSSPVVLVAKKDGSKRLCIDYRKLNAVSQKDAFPLPRIDDTLDSLAGARWFCTLDMASGYWQVEMDPDARQKSAFSTNSGLYSWNVMPFGLCNAPATFERLMERVLSGLHWETLLVYLDDVIVYGRTVSETIARLETVFQRFRSAGLKLKPSKCRLFRSQVEYLGHVVSASGIHTDPAKVEAVQSWPTPRCQTDVRSFIGLASYYRRFIRNFTDIARPLLKLTEKKAVFEWNSECYEAFQRLKTALTSAPILAYPQEHGQFILDTDASAFAIGAVLSQEQDGEERVVAYASKSLLKAERNYCVTRRELLAVVVFLKKFKHYLWGRRIKVRTDHGSLRWLCNFKHPEGQLARWLEVLGSYDIEIIHRPGKSHLNADGLSRRPCSQCGRFSSSSQGENDDKTCVSRQKESEAKSDDPVKEEDTISETLAQFSVEDVSSKNESSENDNDLYSENNVEDTEASSTKAAPTVVDDNGVQQNTKRLDSTEYSQTSSIRVEVTPTKGLLKSPRLNMADHNSKSPKKSVSWKDDQLVEVRYFQTTEIRRILSSRIPGKIRSQARTEGRTARNALRWAREDSVTSDSNSVFSHQGVDTGEADKGTSSGTKQSCSINAVTVEPVSDLGHVREEQLKDNTMAPLVTMIERQQDRPRWEDMSPGPPDLKTYWAQWQLLAVKDGVLCRKWESGDGKEHRWLVVVPRSLRRMVLEQLHDSNTAGHMGEKKTLLKIRYRYYWNGMAADVRSHVRKCDGCARRKGPQKHRRAPLSQYRVRGPLERIAVDVLGPLPETESGNVYVLVVGDYYTKWMETYAIPDQTAETVATKLFDEFVCRFGVPLELHSDQGRNFEAKVFQELCKLLGISKTRTTPYNPKSDGMIERYNRTIANAVSLMIEPVKQQRDWDRYLPHVGFAYRSCVHETTGESPNMMMLGRELALPMDLMVEGPLDEPDYDTDYAEELRERIRLIHDQAREAVGTNSRRQKKNYDRRAVGGTFRVGDFVWLLQKARKQGLTKKLSLPWDGPYLVIKVLTDVVFRIQKTRRSKPFVVHGDRLKPYKGEPLDPWVAVGTNTKEDKRANTLESQETNQAEQGETEKFEEPSESYETDGAKTNVASSDKKSFGDEERLVNAESKASSDKHGADTSSPLSDHRTESETSDDISTVTEHQGSEVSNVRLRRSSRERRLPARYR